MSVASFHGRKSIGSTLSAEPEKGSFVGDCAFFPFIVGKSLALH